MRSLFQPNEVRLSRIVADLFDPNGTHGQGILFLNALLSELDLKRVSPIDHVSVRREMVTKERRQIDLVVEMPSIILGIENKPWAGQQPKQLSDYILALEGWARDRTPVLVFLSNKEPETAVNQIRQLWFYSEDEPSLTNILEGCRERIRASRTRTHVEEMITYLSSEFGGESMVADSNEAYVEAVEVEFERSVDSKRAIAMAMIAQQRLHERLIEEISDIVVQKMQKVFSDLEEDEENNSLHYDLGRKNNYWGVRRPSWPANCMVAISPAKTGYSGIYFGIQAPDGSHRYVDKGDGCKSHSLIKSAAKEIEGGSSTYDWPWWKYAEPVDWSPEMLASLVLESPTGSIIDHPRIKDLIDRMIALAEAIDGAV